MKLEFENESTDVKIDTDMDKFFAEELAIIEMRNEYDRGEGALISYWVLPISEGYWANPKLKGDNDMQIICGIQECNNRLGLQRTDWEGSKNFSPIEKIYVL